MDLPDNDVSSDDSETVDRRMKYRQSWDRNRFCSRSVLRWLSDIFVPKLLGTPEGEVPNQVVIFAPLPGQASYVIWFLRTFHTGSQFILYHTGVASRDRDRLLQKFVSVDCPVGLILTPALGGTGLNLVAANHVIILQKFWNLNEQRQAIARMYRIGQRRITKACILHCEEGVNDIPEERHQSRGKFEARVMHGFIEQTFSCLELMDARATRIHELEAQSAAKASAVVPSPSGPQDDDDNDAPSSHGAQGSDDGTPSPHGVWATGRGLSNRAPAIYRY